MRKEKKREIKQEVKQEVKKPEVKKSVEEVKEVTSLHEAIALQKQGYIVTDVKSEIGGIRLKTWILKK